MRKIIVFLLCIAGAILNIGSNILFCEVLLIPLFLDTILTISVTFLFGPVWGIFTGTLTNVISNTIGFRGWGVYLYSICNIATAFITWIFIRLFPVELRITKRNFPETSFGSVRQDNVMNRIIVLMLLSFFLCLAMSILGGLVTGIIQIIRNSGDAALPNNPGSIKPAMFAGNVPFILNEVLSRIPVNIIDRIISVFAGHGIAVLAIKK
jgi:hypothetical protein